MKRPTLCALGLMLLFKSPAALAGPLPFAEMLPSRNAVQAAPQAAVNLNTRWGFGTRENQYNELIREAVSVAWNDSESPLSPLLYKSLMAVESSFRAEAVSHTGAAGLAQLMPDTARRFGLSMAERMDPCKALPAGIAALEEKHRVIGDPGHYYAVVGMGNKPCPWGERVAAAYQQLGQPSGEDRWYLTLGAYNGGGGTVLRAMAYAADRGLDCRKWDNVAGLPGHNLNTPLYQACAEVFGPRSAASKSKELAEYPRRIFAYYHSAGG